jgi:hypothetical protein
MLVPKTGEYVMKGLIIVLALAVAGVSSTVIAAVIGVPTVAACEGSCGHHKPPDADQLGLASQYP